MSKHEKYRFFLNPYIDCAFTKCPKCDGKTKVKKFPIVIFIEKIKFVLNLNKTCKYCPYCELIIAKKEELKPIADTYRVKVEDFFILGTIPREFYKDHENKLMPYEDFDKIAIPFISILNFTVKSPYWSFENKGGKK